MPSSPCFLLELSADFLKQYPDLLTQSEALMRAYQKKESIEEERLRTVGAALWQALDCEQSFLEEEQKSGQAPLNVIIHSAEARVLQLAWETLYHPQFGFLGQSTKFTLVRQIPITPLPQMPEVAREALCILLFAALPMDIDEKGRLQVEEEKANVIQAVSPLVDKGLVKLIAPEEGRFSRFKQILQEEKPHLVYLSGHGKLQHNQQDNRYYGTFLFEDEYACSLPITEDALAECFNNTCVQAVVLSACESSKSDARQLNTGLSMKLLHRGIPHVIGMRESILDSAGLTFARVFLECIAKQQTIPVALQAARRAMKSILLADISRETQKQSNLVKNIQQQWCLPNLMTLNVHQPLVDWSGFTPQAKAYTPSFNQTLGDIRLPERFLGRRNELYQLFEPLLTGEKKQIILTAAGGMGKTALSGKLCQLLKEKGFEVFAYSTQGSWANFTATLELALAAEVATNYDARKANLDKPAQQRWLLQLLLKQYQGKVVFFLDNLESIQDANSLALTDDGIAAWLSMAQSLTTSGLRLILTSRWCLPDWRPYHYLLEQTRYSDFIAFAHQQGLLRILQSQPQLKARDIHQVLGGNFRAFRFFVKAIPTMNLAQSEAFLAALNQAKDESQTDMALEHLLVRCSSLERELLRRLLAYPIAVPQKGVTVLAKRVEPVLCDHTEHADALERLVSISLVEQIENREFASKDYQVSALVRDYLLQQGKKVEQGTLRVAAQYLHDDLLKERPYLSVALVVHQALLDVEEFEQAQVLLLNHIAPKFHLFGLYQYLLSEYYLPSLKLPLSKKCLATTKTNVGSAYLGVGQYELALRNLEQALPLFREMDDKDGEGSVLNNLSKIYHARGDYVSALSSLKDAGQSRLNDPENLE